MKRTKVKNILLISSLLVAIVLVGFIPSDEKETEFKLRRIVIDAGHGGKDPGTLGKMSKEKDVALAIALKVGGYINELLPDVEVIYTRKTDVFIELKERANIANRNRADLFLSIHCNAINSTRAFGTETYVMGNKNFNANFEIVKRENAVILLEDDYQENYEGFDPKSPESYIMFNLMQKAFLPIAFLWQAKLKMIFPNE